MKYFEQKEPYILIKAKRKQTALLLYADDVSKGILKNPFVFELSEVDERHAYKEFEKSKDFDGSSFSKSDIDFDFYSDSEMILVASADLLSSGARSALSENQEIGRY